MCHKLQDKKYQRTRCPKLDYFMCLPALEEISSPLRHCSHCSTPNSYCSLSHISRPELGHKFFLLDVTCWTFSPLPLKKKQKQKNPSFYFMSYISTPQYYPVFTVISWSLYDIPSFPEDFCCWLTLIPSNSSPGITFWDFNTQAVDFSNNWLFMPWLFSPTDLVFYPPSTVTPMSILPNL